ncbi:DUF2834 domain-containing protein [Nocardioides stalactiti]|uniref:DUF2834 domain-containing protein n=1 Tax=Nocardioides stalactiti TaxID=2755356 RepID=UPI00160337F2|nr:DUF2834 domain-containing protein [Nocardioides stalactiti]
MTRADKILCTAYLVLAAAALVGTQWVLVDYLREGASWDDIVDSSTGNHTAAFLTIDLMVVAVVATIFMVADGLRTGVRFLWVYVLLVFTVAISVAFPLYLVARTRTVARSRTAA